MALSKEEKAKLVKKYARKDGDTGSAEVQIAILTEDSRLSFTSWFTTKSW